MNAVVIYNLGATEKLGVVSLQHAVRMVHRGVARIHTTKEGERFGPYERPTAVELVRYVFARWLYQQTGQTFYSKSGILRRDKHRCAYCSRAANTVDHVLPRSQGGASSWMNVVAACFDCNQRKANRTPEQAKMRLQWLPFVPTVEQAYAR